MLSRAAAGLVRVRAGERPAPKLGHLPSKLVDCGPRVAPGRGRATGPWNRRRGLASPGPGRESGTQTGIPARNETATPRDSGTEPGTGTGKEMEAGGGTGTGTGRGTGNLARTGPGPGTIAAASKEFGKTPARVGRETDPRGRPGTRPRPPGPRRGKPRSRRPCGRTASDVEDQQGVIQIVEVILNGMVLMCIVASYFVLAGFSASFASGGGFGNNYYSPFEGTELEQVRQLDQQYTILRAPLIYGGVAVSLGLGVLTLGVLLQGAKSLHKLPGKWLLLEAIFSLLAAVGYCVGIGIYLHTALQINATDTCRTRERVYARKGLTWMNCQLAGTDGAAATFACLLVVMYGASMVLALRSYREQKQYKDSQEQQRNYNDAPEYVWSGVL
ncbi:PREDICTED: MARVEL domain-containing protein 3 isoform X1 [Capra hircus]|uniref:MARVEL domain-containing protein 3 isoform X1 n=1 Tax=Capra hircus TaxID=9925 RepID=UPI0008465ED5|nr:PREDICTED: MARVEL domain-containing protein 3 isoform X1 [Capra hircus]